MKGKGRKLAIVVLLVIILLAGGLYVGSGYLLGQALERKGFREAIGGKTAEFLDANAGYLPLASDGLSLSSPGFIAVASPPRVVMEMRASRLSTPCNLIELWRGRWRIENVSVQHLQAAIGSDGAQLIKRDEFPDPGLVAPLTTESPPKIDLQNIEIAQTDLF